MKIFMFNSGQGEDYLADLIFGQAIISPHISELYTNFIPGYMFTDGVGDKPRQPCPRPLFGIYGKCDPADREKIKKVSYDDMYDFLSSGTVDKIIYSSIHRRAFPYNHHIADFLGFVLEHFSREQIIAIDGEDPPQLMEDVAKSTIYYKRELLPGDKRKAHPITFAWPTWAKTPKKLTKEYVMAPCDPRYKTSYKFKTEKDYFLQYSKAFFGVTKKKAGWDCMRHYEILACNALPYYLDFENKPKTTQMNWPVELQQRANGMVYQFMHTPHGWFDLPGYQDLSDEFQNWFIEHLMSDMYEEIFK